MSKILISLVMVLGWSTTLWCQAEATDNPELARMYKEDQADRSPGTRVNGRQMAERDEQRKQRVREMLGEGGIRTSNDYAHAAMIFQHGGDTIASEMAVKMMQKAIQLDSSRNKWLLAAAIDRDLMYRGEKQIYGTQFRKDRDGKWELYAVKEGVISDEERKAYNVPPLAAAYARAQRMNAKQLSDLHKAGKTIDTIVQFVRSKYNKETEYDLSENAINNFGYFLMGEKRYEEALKILKLNVEIHPDSYNPWDSYGEILLIMDRKEEAIAAYRKSLVLNPQNRNAESVLKRLE